MLSLNAYITEALVSGKVSKDSNEYIPEYDVEKAIKKFGTINLFDGGTLMEGKLFYKEISSIPLSLDKPVPMFCIKPTKIEDMNAAYGGIFSVEEAVIDKLINTGLGELYVITRYYEFKNPYQRSGLSSKRFDIYFGSHGEIFNTEKECKKFITFAKRENLIPKGSGTKCMSILEAKKFIDEGFKHSIFLGKIYFC